MFLACAHRVGGWGQSKLLFFLNDHTFLLLKILLSQPNFRNKFFDQRSPQPPEVDSLGLQACGWGVNPKYFQKPRHYFLK